MITISKPVFSIKEGWAALHAELTCDTASVTNGVHSKIFFAVPEKFKDYVSEGNSACFLLGLIYYAMRCGQDIHLSGTVPPTLLRRVNTDLIPLLCLYNVHLLPIRVTAETTAEFPAGDRTGTGYSGGVDSTCVFVENYFNPVTPERKITDLCFFNVGTHGLGNTPEQLEATRNKFLKRTEPMKKLPAALNVPLIAVDSNLASFLPDNISAAIGICNAAAVHFLSRRIHHYFFASGYDYRRMFKCISSYSEKTRGYELPYIEALIIPLMETTSLTFCPADNEISRIEKTERIHRYELPIRYLNVCNSHSVMEKNCSVCLKCRRTMNELEILGVLDQYRDCFDVDLFRRQFRSRDFAEIMYPATHTPYQAMMKTYAEEHNFNLRKHTTNADRLCAYMHGTLLYHILQRLAILETLKKAAGRS